MYIMISETMCQEHFFPFTWCKVVTEHRSSQSNTIERNSSRCISSNLLNACLGRGWEREHIWALFPVLFSLHLTQNHYNSSMNIAHIQTSTQMFSEWNIFAYNAIYYCVCMRIRAESALRGMWKATNRTSKKKSTTERERVKRKINERTNQTTNMYRTQHVNAHLFRFEDLLLWCSFLAFQPLLNIHYTHTHRPHKYRENFTAGSERKKKIGTITTTTNK